MTYTYQWVSANKCTLKRTDENGNTRWIPLDPDNRRYQEYLEWLAEGNTPLPADSE